MKVYSATRIGFQCFKKYMENNTNNQEPIILGTKEKKPQSFKSFFIISITLSILFSSFFGAIFGFMGGKISDKLFLEIESKLGIKENGNKQTVNKEKVIEEDSAIIDVVEKSSPAVVSIIITKDVPKYRSFFSDPFGFFGDSLNGQEEMEKQTVGGGSGFLVKSNGMIVTNKHVVSDLNAEYTAITSDGKEYPATVLARDINKDIALIKIGGENFPTLPLGNSDDLKIGQTVIAIGNSLGEFSNSVSKGIISGLRRNITAGSSFGESEKLSDIIQTDAAINSGNSGGPLLDISGNVIGVNVAMAQGAENIAFSIPVNQIKKIVDQVNNTGKISTPFLGVRSIAINKQIQLENNLSFDYGALVARGEKITDFAVLPGSPADKSGLMENDIILEINGIKIDEKNSLADIISELNVGDTIKVKFWHKGEIKNIQIKLEERM